MWGMGEAEGGGGGEGGVEEVGWQAAYGEVLLTSPSAVSTVRCETSRSPHTRHSVAPGAE